MTLLEMRFLGGLQFNHDGAELTDFRSEKGRALLCYLAVTGQSHTRATVSGLLWPESAEANARASLRKVLTAIRKIAPQCLHTSRQTVAIDSDAPIWVDVIQFQKSVLDASDIGRLREAVALYRGDFLDGAYLPDAPAFDRWALGQRTRLRQVAIEALHTLATHFAGSQQYETAISFLRQSLEVEPWRESGHRQLMHYLALDGQRSAALKQYEACCLILAEELGIEPGAATRTLYKQIRDGKLSQIKSPRRIVQHRYATSERANPFSLQHNATPTIETRSTAFVAREREVASLEETLGLALAGRGSVSFVIGESGSGKTALIREFARRTQRKHPHLVAAMANCNAYIGVGDPYLPFREILELLTGNLKYAPDSETVSHSQVRRLQQLMSISIPALVEMGPHLIDTFVSGPSLITRAKTMSSASTQWFVELQTFLKAKAEQGPAEMKQTALFRQYTDVLQKVARKHPLLLIVDDLQWADAGSTSLLFHLGRRLHNQPVLVIGVYRPADLAVGRNGERHPLAAVVNEFQRQFGNPPLDLDQIAGQEFVESFLERIPNRLGSTFREALYRQTEGHALFTVEMLRGLQERGDLVQDEAGRWIEGSEIDWQAMPARIEGIIKERIARLPGALQDILKVASVEGEAFTAEVVARVLALDDRRVVNHLSDELDRQHRLVHNNGTQRIESGGRRSSAYRFRHHLFQSYLYNSLDHAERVYLHEFVGRALEALYSPKPEKIALQLARHFQAAGVVDKAVVHLYQAGERADRLAAYQEAILHFSNALALLATLPDNLARAQQELTGQIALGTTLMKVEGYSAPQVKEAFDRARALCARLGNAPQIFPVWQALYRIYLLRGELDASAEITQQLLHLADQQEDPLLHLPAYLSAGSTSLFEGEFARAQRLFQHCFALDDPHHYQTQTLRFGQNPTVACLTNTALTLWYLGFPDQSLKRSHEAVSLAKELAHVYDVAYALYCASWVHQLRGEVKAAQEQAEAAIELSNEHSIAYWLASATIVRGWTLVEQGQAERGLAGLREGLAYMKTSGAMLLMPYFLALLSESYRKVGQVDEGLALLTEALTIVDSTKERHYEAELHRHKGELILQREGKESKDELLAEDHFSKAIEIARLQRARSPELRATMSLSQLMMKQGKKEEARQMLTTIYDLFDEGLDTRNLEKARTLIRDMT